MKTFLLATLFLSAPVFAAPELILSTTTLIPGQTLRVEVDGLPSDQKYKAFFLGKGYALYPVGPNAQRALIGIALGTHPQDAQLKIRLAATPRLDVMTLAPAVVTISSRTYPQESITFSTKKTKLMAAESRESKKIGEKKKILTMRQLWEGVFTAPVPGLETGFFGVERIRNGKIHAGYHKGVDIKAPAGTPIVAPNHGVVLMAAPFKAHGNIVMLNHGQGVQTIFLHLSKILVKPGEVVKKGQMIGRVGSTGLSTAPHLHWQVYVHGVVVDPDQWLNTEF